MKMIKARIDTKEIKNEMINLVMKTIFWKKNHYQILVVKIIIIKMKIITVSMTMNC